MFQTVPIVAPGVFAVPNPPGPVRHGVSSNVSEIQVSAGFVVMYRHDAASSREIGTTGLMAGGTLNSARLISRSLVSSIFTLERS